MVRTCSLSGALGSACAVLAMAMLATPAALANGSKLYTVSAVDDWLRIVDPLTGKTQWRTRLATTSQKSVVQCNGLALHPTTGALWVVFRMSGTTGGRHLGRLDPATGKITVVGQTPYKFANIAFDDRAVLYGVTGDGAKLPETLFTLSLANAAATKVMPLGAGDDGEAIAFRRGERVLYHASGCCRANLPEKVFEAVDVTAKKTTPIKLSGDPYDEATALTQWVGANLLLADLCGGLFVLSKDGAVSRLAKLDHTAKGLAFVPAARGGFFRPYGTGCAGSGGHVPVLTGNGCPAAGKAVTVETVNALGGAGGIVLIGLSRVRVPISAECALQNWPITPIVLPIRFGSSGAGNGRARVGLQLPAGIRANAYWQTAVIDSNRFVLSNPLHMYVQ